MPLKLPPFNQYQSPIVPLRGLWNSTPIEGDKFVAAEIEWLVTTTQQAVQFAISANSPVSFSQIVALAVDNSRSGSDVQFVFSDSGFILAVPANEQLVAPVFTNGLMFYVVAQGAVEGDITAFSVLNSMPPPIMIAPALAQNHASVIGQPITIGTLPVVAAGVNGTLNTLSLSVGLAAAGESGQFELVDGSGRLLWTTFIEASEAETLPINLSGLSIRFTDGLNLVTLPGSTMTGGVVVNAYYTTP